MEMKLSASIFHILSLAHCSRWFSSYFPESLVVIFLLHLALALCVCVCVCVCMRACVVRASPDPKYLWCIIFRGC